MKTNFKCLEAALGFLILGFAVLFSTNAKAATHTIPCSGCTADQMEEDLVSLMDQLPIPTNDYVYYVNGLNGLSRKFEVFKDYSDPAACDTSIPLDYTPLECVPFIAYDELPVETWVVQALAFAAEGREAILPSNPQFPESAWDEVQQPAYADTVGQWLIDYSWPGFLQWIANGTVNSLGTQISVNIVVHYSDGSTARYTWSDAVRRFVPVAGEYRDRSGNKIPQTPADVSGGGVGTTYEYDFTNNPENIIDFLTRMQSLGVPVTGPSCGTIIACSSVRTPDGRDIVQCEAISGC